MARYLIPSDATIKAVRSSDPRKRLSDGDGLYLLLFVKGGAHGWRLDYTFQHLPVDNAGNRAAQGGRGT